MLQMAVKYVNLYFMTFKTKTQLDTLTEAEIEDYRYNLLTKAGSNYTVNSDVHKYVTELEFYTDTRFDNPTKQFNRWVKEVDNNVGDPLTLSATQLIVKLGLKSYLWINDKRKKDYGDFIYIK